MSSVRDSDCTFWVPGLRPGLPHVVPPVLFTYGNDSAPNSHCHFPAYDLRIKTLWGISL